MLVGTISGGNGIGDPLIVDFNASATAAAIQDVIEQIFFRTVTDNPSTTSRVIDFQLTDGDGGTSAIQSRTIDVTAINDDPYNSGTLPTDASLTEDVTGFVDLSSFNLVDPDAGNNLVTVTLTTSTGGRIWASSDFDVIVSGSGTGSLTLMGGVSDLNNFFSSAFRFSYLHSVAHTNGDNADTITVTVNDGGNTGSGGGGNIVLGTVNIDIDGVNDAPVNSVPGAQTMLEETTLVFSAANGNLITVSDVDVNSGNMTVRLTSSNGTITLSGTSGLVFTTGDGTADNDMLFTGTLADVNAALDGLSFTADPNFVGVANLQMVSNDGGNSGSGGPLEDTDNIIINVDPVNDAPVQTGGSVSNLTVNEDSGLTSLGLTGLSYGPGGGADESGQSLTYEVTVIPDPNNFGKIFLAGRDHPSHNGLLFFDRFARNAVPTGTQCQRRTVILPMANCR